MPAITNPVEGHYTRSDLGDAILAALRDAGKDIDHLTPDDLAPVDEFHSRQRAATIELARLLSPKEADRVLDIGCGLGGPSRFLATAYGCRVTGLDLTAEFCRVAEMLAHRTGLGDRVEYRQGDALALPFPDGAFDAAWSQNASMNIADRDRLYAEMHRVLKPAGRLAIQDVAAGPGGEPRYPVPWAREPGISFLLPPDATRRKLERAGFRVLAWEDKTSIALAEALAMRAKAASAPSPPPALGVHLILGADFRAMMRNSVRNLQEQRTGLLNAVLERTD